MKEVFRPRTFSELWQLRRQHENAALYAGGTDLLVQMRAAKINPQTLICLERLAEIGRIEEFNDEIAIGAGVSQHHLLENPTILKYFPVLCQALQALGSPHIRNMATIGGNIMTASPAGDTLPPLYILQAELELRSQKTQRRLPLADFINGPGQTGISPGEILSRIFIPKEPVFAGHYFEKIGLRQALSIAVVSIAALYNISTERKITAIRLAWGSLGPTIVTLPEVETFLIGKTLNPATLNAAATLVEQQVKPISDIRAGADYRRRVAGQLLLRLDQPANYRQTSA
ncbi:MAG: FAD binding domain-containing protein [Deltaproteobacteria bacterium]|nr:FAD binding domain-containing protein [Deltaproteobacteria bacterium]